MAHMPIFGHTFLAIFWLIELANFMGYQETIIDRLVVRNTSYDAYFSVLIFWATFGGKMGVATTRALMVWGFQTRSRNHIFGIFRGEPP